MKRLLAIVLVSLFAFTFGCGAKAPATTETPVTEAPAMTTDAAPVTPEAPAGEVPAAPVQ